MIALIGVLFILASCMTAIAVLNSNPVGLLYRCIFRLEAAHIKNLWYMHWRMITRVAIIGTVKELLGDNKTRVPTDEYDRVSKYISARVDDIELCMREYIEHALRGVYIGVFCVQECEYYGKYAPGKAPNILAKTDNRVEAWTSIYATCGNLGLSYAKDIADLIAKLGEPWKVV